MKIYLGVAVEKEMNIQEVILRAIDKQITWLQAAEIIRVSPRQLRRWRSGWEKYGYDGLFDRPSPKRVPLETVEKVLRLYRKKYAGFSVQDFSREARRAVVPKKELDKELAKCEPKKARQKDTRPKSD